jgi:predicted dehydrogenase/nucleoside-diphosphate-sugar epimerase
MFPTSQTLDGEQRAGEATAPEAELPRASVPRPGPWRVAVVGAGFIADFHLEILRDTEGVEVVAVCDSDRARAQAAAKRFGVPHAVASVEELPSLGVELAHVLVPPHLHARVARQLFELGIGALVEKPLALSSQEARELGRLAGGRRLALGVNHNALHHPSFARLCARARSGEIGRIEHVQVTLSVPLRQLDTGDFSHWMFRSPRNIVFEQAPHPLAQVHALLGRVESCRTSLLATRELQPGQLFHERWSIAARAERGTAELSFAFGQPFTRSTLLVLGTDGALEADLHHGLLWGEIKTPFLDFWNSFLAGRRRGGEIRRDAWRALRGYLGFTLGLGERRDAFFAGMRASIRSFYAELRAGRPAPIGAEDGAQVLEWCEAITRELPDAHAPEPELPSAGPVRPGEIVVLGATGFIGQRTVSALLAKGLPVTAVVRRTHSLPSALVCAARDGRARLVRGSLEDPAALRAAVRGAKCVLQLATGGGSSWEAIEAAMVRGSLAVGEACIDEKVERFVYVSSIAALYLGPDFGAGVIEDSAPVDPRPQSRALYARGKIAAENALSELRRRRGLPLVIVRPGVVLGRGTALQHSGLGLWVRDNHCVGWGPGDTPLPLVLVDDVADALARIAAHSGGDLDGKSLNLVANVPLTASEVVGELRRASGRALVFHPRALWKSQAMEIGKWLVKRLGGRRDTPFPSFRDLKSRSLAPRFSSRTARETLGWLPVEDRERFLDAAVRVHAPAPRARS